MILLNQNNGRKENKDHRNKRALFS
jgi:hypothetical protein